MKSMTGYAALDRPGRRWELRSVNARGLDLRLRLPEGGPPEPAVRAALSKAIARGGVTLSLRFEGAETGGAALDPAGLKAALSEVQTVTEAAERLGLDLARVSAADILALPGVRTEAGSARVSDAELHADLDALIAAFESDRAREGAGLRQVLAAQIDALETQVAAVEALAPARAAHQATIFEAAVARVAGAGLDADTLQTEIAALAVKSDITEELDRLRLHVAAGRALLDQNEPAGRRLDFLTQEFNREANTLCAKAQMAEVTAAGLEMKTIVDRLREQVQNVE
ncbi:YicC/YloC family endoribonuclease [Jannaschia marina]|uniref:YicC/YloC family endoribonuclease n=1 Tax=Jannaschia marina TaxID=2741674 RepID=UPI001F18D480|nr:YicC/YloC family endoribonuclease [Jannaschia marina]